MGSFIISAERNSAAKFSILEVWFGVGALGFPLLVNYIIKFYEWYFILYGILLFFIFTLFVWYMFGRTKFLNFSLQNNEKGGASLSSFTLKFKSEKITVILFISLFALSLGCIILKMRKIATYGNESAKKVESMKNL